MKFILCQAAIVLLFACLFHSCRAEEEFFESLRLKPIISFGTDPLIALANDHPKLTNLDYQLYSNSVPFTNVSSDVDSEIPTIVQISNVDKLGSEDQMAAASQTLAPQRADDLAESDHDRLIKRQTIEPKNVNGLQQVSRDIDIRMVQSAAKRPPVYMSAPKQIDGLSEIKRAPSDHRKSKPSKKVVVAEVEKVHKPSMKKTSDLNTAADGYYEAQSKKKKKYNKRKYKKPKKKPKKKMPMYQPHHHHEHEDKHNYGSDYYEYREVPKKGAWKYGYKRGNKKHTIERKEHGHKSHFKTEVKWKDKKGKGHSVFDYNHGSKKYH